jgi:hypothetical protein
MKTVVAVAFLALAFTTGFTCSKNQPAETVTETTVPAQDTMGAPAESMPPADGSVTETTVPPTQ